MDFRKIFQKVSVEIGDFCELTFFSRYFPAPKSLLFPLKTSQLFQKVVLLLLLSAFSASLNAQSFPAEKDSAFSTHSSVPVLTLNSRKTAYLQTLGLVWGFLKYYHPAVAAGRYNWDNELFRFLPLYIAAVEDTPQRDAMLYGWVKSLGPVEAGPVTAIPQNAKLTPDLGWIQTSGFSEPLRKALMEIQRAKRPKEQYYVRLHTGAGNPEFLHEIAYDKIALPDAGLRLLALYRYWNMVQYFFPYKNLIGEDWKEVLGEMIPKFAAAETDTAYVFTTQELIGRIHDTHANIWVGSPILKGYFGKLCPPVELAMLDSQLVVTGYVSDSLGVKSGLLPGDVITHINGRPVLEIFKEKRARFPASNEAARARNFADAALRSNDSTVSVTFERAGKSKTKAVFLYDREMLYGNVKPASKEVMFRMLPGNIAYVNNGLLRRDKLVTLWTKIQGSHALIIDDRNYSSEFVIHDFCNYLLPKPTVFYHATRPSLAQPGLFTREAAPPTGQSNRNPYKGKVAILVNEQTQSSAEFHALAYQAHPNAVVVGSQTAGADGNVSHIILPGGLKTMFSGIGIYYPDGRETQRVGVAVDIEVRPTAAGLAAGKDEVLERAVEWIHSGK